MFNRRCVLGIGFFFILVLGISAPGCMMPTIFQQKLQPGWQIICPSSAISALAVQGDIIWAAAENDVYCIDRRSGTIVKKLGCNPPLEYIKALLPDRSGGLFIGHFNGLTYYDGATFRTFTNKDGLPDNRVNALLEDADRRLWVGTWSGAAIRQAAGWRTLKVADGLADDMVNVLLQDSKGGMWFGSYVAPAGGISYLNNNQWQVFSTRDGLPHNDITSLIECRDGTVWAGTGFSDHGGAAQFLLTNSGCKIQRTLTYRDGLAGNKVRSLLQDRDGALWFGSEYDGLARYQNGRWLVISTNEGLSHPEVLCMLQDVDGNLWIGTRDGITRLSLDAIRALP